MIEFKTHPTVPALRVQVDPTDCIRWDEQGDAYIAAHNPDHQDGEIRLYLVGPGVRGLTPGPVRFFDSHGAPWVVCDPDEPGAQAFGPKGSARPWEGGPTYTQAHAAGQVIECNGWSIWQPAPDAEAKEEQHGDG